VSGFRPFKNALRVRIKLDGHSFQSKGEAACYAHLKFLEKAGYLTVLQVQDHVRMTDAQILYIADFVVMNLETGEKEWAEFKGFETDIWKIKKRLWEYYGPGILKIYKQRSNGSVFHHDTVVPKIRKTV